MSFFKNLFGGDKKKKLKLQQQQQEQQNFQQSQNPYQQHSQVESQFNHPINGQDRIKKQQQKTSEYKQIEKSVMKSCLASNSLDKLSTEELKVIRNLLEFNNPHNSQSQTATATFSQNIGYFLNVIESNNFSLPSKLKILTALHKFIIELGDQFASEFLDRNLNPIFSFDKSSNSKTNVGYIPKNNTIFMQDKNTGKTIRASDLEGWMYENVLQHYFNYLLRLANNYQIYKICIEEGELPETDDAKLDYKLKFMWLFKLSNLFSYILPIHRNLCLVLREMCEWQLIQDIALLLLHDCVSYYNVMSKEMSQLLESYTLLTTIDSIQFYQIYCEVNELSKDLREFYLMKELFDQQDFIIEPLWFDVTIKKHKEIEMYSHKVELLNTSAAEMRKTLKNGQDVLIKSQQINFTETSAYNGNQIEKQARSKTAFHGNNIGLNSGSGKKNERVRTESAVMIGQKMYAEDEEDGIREMEEDDMKAIRIYENMLKEQKRIELGEDSEDEGGQKEKKEKKGQQDQEGEKEEEEKCNLQNEIRKNKVDAFVASVQDNQVLQNQEILFSPGKPITFRCQLADKSNNKEEENNNNNDRGGDNLKGQYDDQEIEVNKMQENVKLQKNEDKVDKYSKNDGEEEDIVVKLDQMDSCQSEEEEAGDADDEPVRKRESGGNKTGDFSGNGDSSNTPQKEHELIEEEQDKIQVLQQQMHDQILVQDDENNNLKLNSELIGQQENHLIVKAHHVKDDRKRYELGEEGNGQEIDSPRNQESDDKKEEQNENDGI